MGNSWSAGHQHWTDSPLPDSSLSVRSVARNATNRKQNSTREDAVTDLRRGVHTGAIAATQPGNSPVCLGPALDPQPRSAETGLAVGPDALEYLLPTEPSTPSDPPVSSLVKDPVATSPDPAYLAVVMTARNDRGTLDVYVPNGMSEIDFLTSLLPQTDSPGSVNTYLENALTSFGVSILPAKAGVARTKPWVALTSHFHSMDTLAERAVKAAADTPAFYASNPRAPDGPIALRVVELPTQAAGFKWARQYPSVLSDIRGAPVRVPLENVIVQLSTWGGEELALAIRSCVAGERVTRPSLPAPHKLHTKLAAMTAQAQSGIAALTREYAVTSRQRPDGTTDVYAVHGRQNWSEVAKFVAHSVEIGELDRPSRQLWIEFASHMPDFPVIFGDTPVEALELSFGAGLKGGRCSYVYDPAASHRRMDISAGPDSQLWHALRDPLVGQTPAAVRARVMSAARAVDRPFRLSFLSGAEPLCAMGCGRHLRPVYAARPSLSPPPEGAELVDAEVHHEDPTLASLVDECFGVEPHPSVVREYPHHHEFVDSPASREFERRLGEARRIACC